MERLTERFDGWAMRKDCHGPCRTCDRCECADIYPMIARLAAYEDTGLEPEEMLTGKELVEIACALDLLKKYQSFGPVDRFRELAQAEQDGRLVVLPFREADYIYRVVDMQSHSAFNDFVSCDRVVPFGIPFESSFGGVRIIPIEQFGKTVFLTREEAEAALKKREEEDNGH